MILGGKQLQQYIQPFHEKQCQPASYDCTIGTQFLRPAHHDGPVDLSMPVEYHACDRTSYTLCPGDFCLATTREHISLPKDIAAYVEGRSSIGRLGLFVQNAGFIDPGFEGQITLELFNASRNAITIAAGQTLCQIVFLRTEGVEMAYAGKYQNQLGTTGSRIYREYI